MKLVVPNLGDVTKHAELGWYESRPVHTALLGDVACVFVLDGYESDDRKEDFQAAIARFIVVTATAIDDVLPSLFEYYLDTLADGGEELPVAAAGDVRAHIKLGTRPVVKRGRDQHVYVSLECECAWEPEHGLQLVFKDGERITKLGPFDDQLINERNVVYASTRG